MAKDADEKAGVPFQTWFRKSYSVDYNAYRLPAEGGTTAAPITAAPAGAEAAVVNLLSQSSDERWIGNSDGRRRISPKDATRTLEMNGGCGGRTALASRNDLRQ